jgi:tetratricopeptide (TPR) repeat protein
MNTLCRLLLALVCVEMVVCGGLVWLRLSETRPVAPRVELYNDSLTGKELLTLPDRFLFDSQTKWRTLGEAHMVMGYFAKAEACLRMAGSLSPGSAEISFAHGLALERLGQIDLAIAAFAQATLGRRGLAETAWYHMGRNHLRLERADEAAHAFVMAGEEHAASLYQRARLLVRSGRAAEAAGLVAILAESHPDDLRVLQLRAAAAGDDAQGRALAARDQLDRAREILVVDDREEYYKPIRERYGLAREIARANRLRESGDTAGAAALLASLARGDPLWENSYLHLLQDSADLAVQAGDMLTAARLLREQFDRQQFPTPVAWELWGDVELSQGHENEAREAWNRALRMAPTPQLHIKLASLAQRLNDQPLYRKHIALAGQAAGIALFRANRIAEAVATLKKAATLPGAAELPRLWFYLGEIERLENEPQRAREAYRRCLALDPDHGRALDALAKLDAR